jgi:arylsulfatase A-like enzyme
MFPTILAAAGVQPDAKLQLDGQNVLDVLCGKAKAPDRTLYWEWREGGNVQYAAMHGDLKMVINSQNKPELYNVETDPAERRDIAQEYPAEVKAMQKGLDKWMAAESEAAKQHRPPKKKKGAAAAAAAEAEEND